MCAVGSQHPAPLYDGVTTLTHPQCKQRGQRSFRATARQIKTRLMLGEPHRVYMLSFLFLFVTYLAVLAVCILSLMHVLYTVYVHIYIGPDSRKTTINSVQFKWEWTNVYAEICYANVTWGLLFFISVADIAGARSQEFHSPRHMCCGDVTIKLIWFDFQWAAWLWLFALFFTQLFNILYRFFILLFLLISLFCSHYNSFVFILFKWFKIIFSVFFQLLLICFVVLSSFC